MITNIVFSLYNRVFRRKITGIKVQYSDGISFYVYVPLPDLMFLLYELILSDMYEYLDIFRLNKISPRLVVDIGAHVGLFSIRASFYSSKVYAIEPNPLTNYLLELNCKVNKRSNVSILRCGIWKERTITYLLSPEPFSVGAFIDTMPQSNSHNFIINTLTLEDLFAQILGNKKEIIDLVKIDIEGSEYDVILNTSHNILRKVKRYVVELHDLKKHYRVHELIDHFISAGFKIFILKQPYELVKRTFTSLSNFMMRRVKIEGIDTPFLLTLGMLYDASTLALTFLDITKIHSLLYAWIG